MFFPTKGLYLSCMKHFSALRLKVNGFAMAGTSYADMSETSQERDRRPATRKNAQGDGVFFTEVK